MRESALVRAGSAPRNQGLVGAIGGYSEEVWSGIQMPLSVLNKVTVGRMVLYLAFFDLMRRLIHTANRILYGSSIALGFLMRQLRRRSA